MIKRLEITLTRPPGAPAAFLDGPRENLVSRARDGDEEAFRFIFERYARPIISFIYDMIGKQEAAEELAQETFVRAFKNLGSLQSDAQLSTWLFGIAKNVTREALRAPPKRKHCRA
ncbi:MAG: sigma-70 family RNA polymerase sigma factor [Pyrinomonadaceae bacterium]